MNRCIFFISLIFGWLAVSISPIFDTIIVSNSYDLSYHRLGFPLPIIEQHTSLTPMVDDFPLTLGLLNPQENTTDLLVFNYILSILIISLTIMVSIQTIRFLVRKLINV
ncbi:hypothetical protein [Bacillus sp. USDA818B3_A]|uniref:hypothetical protein n=1 Tax=Bacillus sp. USDA818B3_A TaxID=2698834 RepID=UPI00136D9FB1|nr:hypothetical protein [Bacillus sp. USDA818B3_A]